MPGTKEEFKQDFYERLGKRSVKSLTQEELAEYNYLYGDATLNTTYEVAHEVAHQRVEDRMRVEYEKAQDSLNSLTLDDPEYASKKAHYEEIIDDYNYDYENVVNRKLNKYDDIYTSDVDLRRDRNFADVMELYCNAKAAYDSLPWYQRLAAHFRSGDTYEPAMKLRELRAYKECINELNIDKQAFETAIDNKIAERTINGEYRGFTIVPNHIEFEEEEEYEADTNLYDAQLLNNGQQDLVENLGDEFEERGTSSNINAQDVEEKPLDNDEVENEIPSNINIQNVEEEPLDKNEIVNEVNSNENIQDVEEKPLDNDEVENEIPSNINIQDIEEEPLDKDEIVNEVNTNENVQVIEEKPLDNYQFVEVESPANNVQEIEDEPLDKPEFEIKL